MKDTFFSKEKKIVAIIYCNPADPLSGRSFLKYSYVDNVQGKGVSDFLTFAKGFHTAQYINFYSRVDGRYLGRINLTENQNENNYCL
jgi:hypothetical protein